MQTRGVSCLAAALVACGPTHRPATPTTPAAPTATTASSAAASPPPGARRATAASTDGPVDPTLACDHLLALARSGCPSLQGYELDRAMCIDNLHKELEERGPDARAVGLAMGRCFLRDDCAAFDTCISDAQQAMGVPETPPLRACADHDTYGAVGYPRAEWERRTGAGVRHFSELATTKDAPVEVCGIPAEGQWLVEVRCDDGSNPFRSPGETEPARVGNVGPGGRCGAIVDQYAVACPERTYEVFIDAYVCPSD